MASRNKVGAKQKAETKETQCALQQIERKSRYSSPLLSTRQRKVETGEISNILFSDWIAKLKAIVEHFDLDDPQYDEYIRSRYYTGYDVVPTAHEFYRHWRENKKV